MLGLESRDKEKEISTMVCANMIEAYCLKKYSDVDFAGRTL